MKRTMEDHLSVPLMTVYQKKIEKEVFDGLVVNDHHA